MPIMPQLHGHSAEGDSEKATPPSGKPTFDENGKLTFSLDDMAVPHNWSTTRKCFVTGIGMLMTFNAGFASSAPTGALEGIVQTFHVSSVAANLITTLFLAGYCFGPLFWGPLSEFYGRHWIFYISFTGYFAFNFLCAFTLNFGGLLAGRFLSGTSISAIMSNAPGLLVDLWGPVGRGNGLALFIVFTFMGPALGPIISGFLDITAGWRWSFYVLLWLAAGTILVLPFLPETLGAQILVTRAKMLRKTAGYGDVQAPAESPKRSLIDIFKRALIRPWQVLFDPIAFLVAAYFAIVYAVLYMHFTIYPIIFQEKR